MGYIIALTSVLAGLWLALSGQITVLSLCLCGFSVLVCLIIVYRLDMFDRESVPYMRVGRFGSVLTFWACLWFDMTKSLGQVLTACLRVDLDIRPAFVRLKTSGRSDPGRSLFANAVSLRPGSVTLTIEDERLLIHALYEDRSLPESFLTMDRLAQVAAGDLNGKAKDGSHAGVQI